MAPFRVQKNLIHSLHIQYEKDNILCHHSYVGLNSHSKIKMEHCAQKMYKQAWR